MKIGNRYDWWRTGRQCDHRIRRWEGNSLMTQNNKKVHTKAKMNKKVRAGMTMKIATALPVPWVELTATERYRDVVVDTTCRPATTINESFSLISKYPEFSCATIKFFSVESVTRILHQLQIQVREKWKMLHYHKAFLHSLESPPRFVLDRGNWKSHGSPEDLNFDAERPFAFLL